LENKFPLALQCWKLGYYLNDDDHLSLNSFVVDNFVDEDYHFV
jgi:hypothetical protein